MSSDQLQRPRANQAPIKVICVGLGRTGTVSLSEALNILGFGPAYHLNILARQRNDYPFWVRLSETGGSPEDFDEIFSGYSSVLDYPAAMHAKELLAAYPDAKFILTDRDPAKWEQSVHSTFLPYAELSKRTNLPALVKDFFDWSVNCVGIKFHRRMLREHAQEAFMDHKKYITELIPSERLLIYSVKEGWDPLVQFLGVPQPIENFPHVNDTTEFNAFWHELENQEVETKEI